jgi:hypothetical protein
LKKASLWVSVLALTCLVAPALSTALNDPQTIVYDFLNRSIGKSKGVAVLQPEALVGDPDFDFVVKVRGGPENAPTLATIMLETMRECIPGQPCTFYPGTDRVLIQAINLDGTPATPLTIDGR